jgi:hypothetical protein
LARVHLPRWPPTSRATDLSAASAVPARHAGVHSVIPVLRALDRRGKKSYHALAQVPRARRHESIDLVAERALQITAPQPVVTLQVTHQPLYSRPATTTLALLVSLITAITLQWRRGQNNRRLPDRFNTAIASVTHRCVDGLIPHRIVRRYTPAIPADDNQDVSANSTQPNPTTPMSWMQRLRGVFQIDLSHCPRCGGTVRVVASITEPALTNPTP